MDLFGDSNELFDFNELPIKDQLKDDDASSPQRRVDDDQSNDSIPEHSETDDHLINPFDDHFTGLPSNQFPAINLMKAILMQKETDDDLRRMVKRMKKSDETNDCGTQTDDLVSVAEVSTQTDQTPCPSPAAEVSVSSFGDVVSDSVSSDADDDATKTETDDLLDQQSFNSISNDISSPTLTLLSQISTSTDSPSIRCDWPMCNSQFKTQMEFDEHWNWHIITKYPHRCGVDGCNQRFGQVKGLRVHQQCKHPDYYRHLCQESLRRFQLQQQAQYQRMNQHHPIVGNQQTNFPQLIVYRDQQYRLNSVSGQTFAGRLSVNSPQLDFNIFRFRCPWPSCQNAYSSNKLVDEHVKIDHLMGMKSDDRRLVPLNNNHTISRAVKSGHISDDDVICLD